MVIGRIDFSGKKKHTKLLNYADGLSYIYDWLFEMDHRVLICSKCGIIDVPCFSHYGPISGGWRKNASTKLWVCHWCSYGGTRDSREVRKENKYIRNKMIIYTMNHPWAKFKY